VTSFDDAEAKCMKQGARLWQPRSTASKYYFRVSEKVHLSLQNLFVSETANTLVATGLLYQNGALYYRCFTFNEIYITNQILFSFNKIILRVI
jgi:hypothetical protein